MSPSVQTSALCRSCGASILWAETEHGKPMPVQEEAGGNVILLVPDDPRGAPIARVLGKGSQVVEGTVRYVSHFARCQQASQWRRP